MDVEFMLSDSLEVRGVTNVIDDATSDCGDDQAVRPKLVLYKTFEEAAQAVDELFNRALQNAGGKYILKLLWSASNDILF